MEAEAKGPFFEEAGGPGQPEYKPWERKNHDGSPGAAGRMGMLRGRVFEKCGVHFSHVHGQFAPEFANQIPGADADPRFSACGISLIAHPWNPNAPTVHMNTRFVVTSKAWFGGGPISRPCSRRGACRRMRIRSPSTRACVEHAWPMAATMPATRRGATNTST